MYVNSVCIFDLFRCRVELPKLEKDCVEIEICRCINFDKLPRFELKEITGVLHFPRLIRFHPPFRLLKTQQH